MKKIFLLISVIAILSCSGKDDDPKPAQKGATRTDSLGNVIR